ncbi:MAG: thioesterase family protein [Steroidobacter sp.]
MQFSEILASFHGTDEECRVTVSDDWLQGRATFGGLVAAVGNEAMRKFVPRERALRSLQTTFVGPAGAGTWKLRAQVLRVGKAVTLARCEVIAGDQLVATQIGVYGMDRESAVLVKPTPTDPPRKVDEINELRFVPDRAPAFVQHFALRFAEGAKPFTSTRSPSKVFIKHRDPSPLTESHIVALVDCIPTPALSMFKAPAPGSSLVWMLEFFEHDLEFAPDAWWRIDTDIDAATGGYVNQTGLLHDPNGRPVALSRQLFAVFG